MTLNYTTCFYHPDRTAVNVCSRCRRPICLEDKNIYEYSNRSTGLTMSSSYNSRIYCPGCYSSLLNLKVSSAPMIIVMLFFSIFFFIIFAIFSLGGITESSPFVVTPLSILFGITFFLIIFIFIVVGINIKSTNQKFKENQEHIKEINYQQRKLEGFIGNDIDDTVSKKSILDPQKNVTVSCYQCGTQLTLIDKFCPTCGDLTQDELKDYYKVQKN